MRAPELRRPLALGLALWGGIAACCAPVAAQDTAAVAAPAPFEAVYAWKWHDITVAVSTLRFEQVDGSTWRSSSSSEPRGLGRLYPIRPKLQSLMRVDSDGVRPLHYQAEDGTAGNSRGANVRFDWDAMHASGTYNGTAIDLALHPGVQDDLSVQIAMLAAVRAGHVPQNLSIIDRNTIRDYDYRQLAPQQIMTALGAVDAVVYSSQHPGSPRITRFWCAPEHGYVPLKVEQRIGDDVQWSMEIMRLTGG
jgi:uncharacterized protein DUF3108